MEHELAAYEGSRLLRRARELVARIRACIYAFDQADGAFHTILEVLQEMEPGEYRLAKDYYEFRELYWQAQHYVWLLQHIIKEIERLEEEKEEGGEK